MTNQTTPAATGGDLAELWRERVAALVEGNYDRSYEIDDLIRAARPTDPAGSRFSSVSCFSKWMWKTHRMIARW
jgi:hypothetical protein